MSLRIALACDWLTTPGGAEKVLLELHHMHPDAPIYTSQYSKKGIDWFNDADVRTGWLQIFPKSLRKILGPLRQLYFSHLDLSDYDVVISVTGAEAKAIKTKPSVKKHSIPPLYHASSKKSIETPPRPTFHLCYCHVPTQYYWQMYDRYVENPGFGFLNPLVRFVFKLLVKPLRKADYKSAQQPDQFVTISTYAQAQIKQYYHRDSIIVPPPVEIEQFIHNFSTKVSTKTSDFSTTISTKTGNLSTTFPPVKGKFSTESPRSTQPTQLPYFIIACRQVTWKRVDLAIKACKKLHLHLKVVGAGSEHQRLVKLANNSQYIEFIPWVEARELASLLQHAEAYLFPSLEPFGVAAVEALAAGCPVIACAKGGSQDFIQDRKNGLLFPKQTVDSLAQALQEFQSISFDRAKIRQSATKFSSQNFRRGIKNIIKKESQTHENL